MAEKERTVSTSSGDEVSVKKNVQPISNLNSAVNKMLNTVKAFSLTGNLKNEEELDEFEKSIDDVLNKETERFVSSDNVTSGKDIAFFLNSIFTNTPKGLKNTGMASMLQNQSLEQLMSDENSQINIILSEKYKNVNSMYEDLDLICRQVSELNEVVDTMRDAIVNSDNIIADISRNLKFDSSSDTSKSIETVKSMEDATGVKDKLKKIIIPETLKFGNFFVFTQPYKDLFAKFKAMDDKYKRDGIAGVAEAFTPTDDYNDGIEALFESYKADFEEFGEKDKNGKPIITKEGFTKKLDEYMEAINVINNPMVPLMEDSDISGMADPDIRSSVEKAIKAKKKGRNWEVIGDAKGKSPYRDGVLDATNTDVVDAENKYKQEYSDISGVFLKLYDPRRVIPVYIMDYCIGYYVLYETVNETTSNVLNAVHTLSRTTMMFQNSKKREFEAQLVGLIADRVCRSIDKPFLKKNAEFKELIANAIAYDDFYKKSFRVQFVPVNYMTHFKISEDYNTHMGVSVLKRSLFYGMLYLTILLFKIIMIVTRSSDTRMFMVHGNGVDKNLSNRISKVVTDYKLNQISYNDFGSVRGILSKIGKARDVAIPVGSNGQRGFEIEVMQGQDVPLDTPLIEFLRKEMISNTGCPSAMLNYLDEVDFAKQIQMLHSKFVSRMVSMQEETEHPITELYRKLLKYGDYDIEDKELDSFSFEWARPKSLNVTNINDMISSCEQLAEFMVKVFEGENSSNDPRIKDRFFKYLVTKVLMTGVFDWDKLEKDLEKVALDLRADLKEEDAIKIKTGDNDQGGY